MKNLYFFALLLFAAVSFAQQSHITNINNVRARLDISGCFFTESAVNRAAYEVPRTINGLGADVIYNSAFWIGAKDQNDSVRVCANKFINDPKDFRPGPVANNYTDVAFITKYNRLYTVERTEIEQHQLNWNDPSYIIPSEILNWPGNGNSTNGEASLLAPFVDYNANNIYEPLLGDHPLIRGDEATFFILNDDDGNHALSGGVNLGMEYHFMVYQYLTNDILNDQTFINLKVINRSQETFDQLTVANYTDFDIGGPGDDYVGCSSDKNMMFGYNADNNDDVGFATSFGPNPPACGVKLLNHQIGVSGYYDNGGGAQADPSTTADFWNYMTGKWLDGSNFTDGGNGYGGTVPTNFLFDGNPSNSSAWTEVSEASFPGDRRAFITSEPIDNFQPNDFVCFDYAVIYSRVAGGNNIQNVDELFDRADEVQFFYDSQVDNYCQAIVLSAGEEEVNPSVQIYPNPTNSDFSVFLDGEFSVVVYDLTGKIIKSIEGLNSNQNIAAPESSGVYFVTVKQNNYSETLKLVVR